MARRIVLNIQFKRSGGFHRTPSSTVNRMTNSCLVIYLITSPTAPLLFAFFLCSTGSFVTPLCLLSPSLRKNLISCIIMQQFHLLVKLHNMNASVLTPSTHTLSHTFSFASPYQFKYIEVKYSKLKVHLPPFFGAFDHNLQPSSVNGTCSVVIRNIVSKNGSGAPIKGEEE